MVMFFYCIFFGILRFETNNKINNCLFTNILGTSKKIDTTCPVALQQEVVPFLYESFETALVECFPDIGLEMLMVRDLIFKKNFELKNNDVFSQVLGSVITGSRHNAIQSISPATSKMLLKTVIIFY